MLYKAQYKNRALPFTSTTANYITNDGYYTLDEDSLLLKLHPYWESHTGGAWAIRIEMTMVNNKPNALELPLDHMNIYMPCFTTEHYFSSYGSGDYHSGGYFRMDTDRPKEVLTIAPTDSLKFRHYFQGVEKLKYRKAKKYADTLRAGLVFSHLQANGKSVTLDTIKLVIDKK